MPTSTIERITLAEAHERMQAQDVSQQQDYAFICPICRTVQSMASLVLAGDTPEDVERHIAFSCEGRFRGAGPWPGDKERSKAAIARRKIRGCDWTLGGLFQLHKLEIEYPDGSHAPSFEIADKHHAQSLAAWVKQELEKNQSEAVST